MRYPNLFILGAPKCGTTVLSTWLSQCPEVCFSSGKEPHWFSEEHRLTQSWDVYQQLFSVDREKWVAEASVWYLYSDTAVPNILEFNPESRFIVMLREPVGLIASMHEQHLFNGNELEGDLARALALNDRRANGEPVMVRRGYQPVSHLAYFQSCALGAQVKRLLARADRERVFFVRFDDLQAQPGRVWKDLLAFLQIDGKEIDFSRRVNGAKCRKSRTLDQIVLRLASLKQRIGVRSSLGLLSRVRRANVEYRERPPVPEALKSHIRSVMADDVRRLDSLLHGAGSQAPSARTELVLKS